MYCGKSEELIRRLRRAEIAKRKVVAFKPSVDDRWPDNSIFSHSGHEIPCIVTADPYEVLTNGVEYDIIGIDEVQFYDESLLPLIESLIRMGKSVIVTGLDQTYRAEPFGIMPYLLAVAEKVDKLTAICNVCGSNATRTQRLLDGRPAPFDGPTVLVGASEAYEARCRGCFEEG